MDVFGHYIIWWCCCCRGTYIDIYIHLFYVQGTLSKGVCLLYMFQGYICFAFLCGHESQCISVHSYGVIIPVSGLLTVTPSGLLTVTPWWSFDCDTIVVF